MKITVIMQYCKCSVVFFFFYKKLKIVPKKKKQPHNRSLMGYVKGNNFKEHRK